MKKYQSLILLFVFVFSGCGDVNVLDNYSNADSDEARYFEATTLLDERKWSQVISIIENDLSNGFAARSEVQETLASAYAGHCGYTFADILVGLQDATDSRFFPLFLDIFSSNSIVTTSCDHAITVLQGLGTVTERTSKQNLMLSILGMARIGTTLAVKLDPGATGTADPAANVCSRTDPGVPYLAEADIKKVATGIGLIFENISALGGLLGSGSNSLSGLTDALNACQGLGLGVNCIVTNEAEVDSPLDYVTRVMLDTGDFGFKTCDMNTAGSCCPGLTP